jgi:ATP-dependent Clp protease ATP-binding subunit ClpB
MTSNIGSNLIRENFEKITDANREQIIEETRNMVFELLKQTIRPEFLNRVDDLIMFMPLTKKEIRDIVKLQLNNVSKQLSSSGASLQVSEKAIDWLAEAGYDPQFGARPIKRAIQKYLLNELSKQIIAQQIDLRAPILVDVSGDKLVFSNNGVRFDQ